MLKIKISIPWKHLVSKNNKTILLKGRRPALTKEYREGKEESHRIALEQYDGKPIEGSVNIVFRFFPPDKRRRDIFNYQEMLCDGIEGVVYVNDVQIDDGRVLRRKVSKTNPRVDITIREIE